MRSRMPLAIEGGLTGLLHLWLLVVAHFAALADGSLGSLRENSCLTGGNSVPFSERKNATRMGSKVPIGLGVFAWSAGRLEAYILRIIIEEVLGYHTVFGQEFTSSSHALYAMGGCQEPTSLVGCSHVMPQKTHFTIGAWWSYTQAARNDLQEHYSNRMPKLLGGMGYEGREAFYLTWASLQLARTEEHLPLEYYYSFSHPKVDLSQFFNGGWMNFNKLLHCNDTSMHNTREIANYLRLSNDNDGVEGDASNLRAKCYYDHWWLSPRCRANRSTCVPHVTGGNGWRIDAMMQRAAAFDMPMAIAVTDSVKDVVYAHRCTFYSFWPDTALLALRPQEILFPPHNELQWAEQDLRSRSKGQWIAKLAYHDLLSAANAGFDMAWRVAENLRLTSDDMNNLTISHLDMGETMEAAEEVACRWLNANRERWQTQWIPSASTCEESKGMIDQDGHFLETHTGATNCEFCQPGYHSVRYSAGGQSETFICKKCPKGRVQGEMGKTVCVECPVGEVADKEGQAACTRCDIGRFAARKGLEECTACNPGLVTEHPGATDASDCICPAGEYWDPNRRACTACKVGMVCRVGSDARGFQTENANRFPVVPMLMPSYWSSADDPLNVFRCENALRCPGEVRPGQGCSPRLEGRACSMCEQNYRWNSKRCVRCPQRGQPSFIFFCVPFLIVTGTICVMYKLSGNPYKKWGSWQNGIAVVGFILLNHYQVVNITRGADMVLPSGLVEVYDSFVVSSNQMTIFYPDCVGVGDFKSLMIIRALGPLFLFMTYLAIWCMAWLISETVYKQVHMNADRTLNGFLSLIYTFFTGIVSMCFSIFKCGPNPNGKSSLIVDRSITCYEGEWNGMLAIGVLSVLSWCCGFGLLFLWRVCTVAGSFHEPRVQKRWKFLFIRYRPDVHWWALVVVAKGILLNLGFVVMDNPVGQLFWVCAVLAVYEVLLFMFRPLRQTVLNNLDLWAHIALLISTAFLMRFTHLDDTDTPEDSLINGLIIASVVSVCPVCLPSSAYLVWKQNSLAEIQERKKRCEVILLTFASMEFEVKEREHWNAFCQRLGEWDFQMLSLACEVLDIELNQLRVRRGYSVNELSGKLTRNSSELLPDLEQKMSCYSSRHSITSKKSRGARSSVSMGCYDGNIFV